MIGIITISHGDFAEEILNSIRLVIGQHDHVVGLTLQEYDSVDTLNNKFKSAISTFDTEKGVLILVDVLGGTPFNVAMMNARDYKCTVITGLNFPMLIEAISSRDSMELEELTKVCVEAGQQGIQHIKQ